MAKTESGEVIIVLNQQAYYGRDKIIHSAGRIEHYKNMVDGYSIKVGDEQNIVTNNSYDISISIKDYLLYVLLRPYADEE